MIESNFALFVGTRMQQQLNGIYTSPLLDPKSVALWQYCNFQKM